MGDRAGRPSYQTRAAAILRGGGARGTRVRPRSPSRTRTAIGTERRHRRRVATRSANDTTSGGNTRTRCSTRDQRSIVCLTVVNTTFSALATLPMTADDSGRDCATPSRDALGSGTENAHTATTTASTAPPTTSAPRSLTPSRLPAAPFRRLGERFAPVERTRATRDAGAGRAAPHAAQVHRCRERDRCASR